MNMKTKGFLQSLTPRATVSYMTRYGLVVRSRSFPRKVNTEAAQRSRATFRLASRLWRALTDTERAALGPARRPGQQRARAATIQVANRTRPLRQNKLRPRCRWPGVCQAPA